MSEAPAAAPFVWRLEVANVLLIAERRGRIEPAAVDAYLEELAALPVIVAAEPADVAALLPLARRHGLTVYDASYLDLAMRLDWPLATLHRRLADAARAEGVAALA